MTNEEAIYLLRRTACDGCRYLIKCTRDEEMSLCFIAQEMGANALEKQTQEKPHRNIDDLTGEQFADILYNWHRKKAPCDGCDQSDERVMRCAKAAARYYFFSEDEQKENNK